MKLIENWPDTVILPSVRNKSCGSVLDSLSVAYKSDIWADHKVNVILRSQKHELMSEGIP